MAGSATGSLYGTPYGGSFSFTSTGALKPTQQQQPAATSPYSSGSTTAPTVGGSAQSSYGYGPAMGEYASNQAFTQAQNQFNMQNAQMENQRRMQQASLDAQAQQARMAAEQRAQSLQGLQSMFAEAQGQWGGNAPPMPMMNAPQQVQMAQLPAQKTIGAPDMAAAQQAQFARAKDQAGEVARSALAGLRSTLGGRGLLGSGAELRGTANVANRGVAQLGELSRDQAIQGSQANQQAALANFQGGVTQRAQDMQQQNWVNQFNAQQQAAYENRQADWAMRERENQQQAQQRMAEMMLGAITRY